MTETQHWLEELLIWQRIKDIYTKNYTLEKATQALKINRMSHGFEDNRDNIILCV